jgi:Rhodanese-like domain.
MSAYKQISVKDTKEMIATNIYLLDIRDQKSFERGHIPSAVHLSNESI